MLCNFPDCPLLCTSLQVGWGWSQCQRWRQTLYKTLRLLARVRLKFSVSVRIGFRVEVALFVGFRARVSLGLSVSVRVRDCGVWVSGRSL